MSLISVHPSCSSQDRIGDTEAAPVQLKGNKLFTFKLFYNTNIIYTEHKQI